MIKLDRLPFFAAVFMLLFWRVYAEDKKPEWTDDSVPSIKEYYRPYLESFGLCCSYKPWDRDFGELMLEETRKGVVKHADSITLENELKPESIFGIPWGKKTPRIAKEKFTASNGRIIEVPELNGFARLNLILQACRDTGLVMRGHVLVWHSQTPDAFFAENYAPVISKGMILNPVDKETMTARQEWYIKTVIGHVVEWERKNNGGKHIVWAWDVVNEAVADDASKVYSGEKQQWLRGGTPNTRNRTPKRGGSRWYQIYGNDEYIINAFRFAAAYAPPDIKLCYNEVNEFMEWAGSHGSWKTSAVLHLLKKIRGGPAAVVNGKPVSPRIDAVGMQTHVRDQWPKLKSYETALVRFLDAGFDVHVTEFDVATRSRDAAAKSYGDYFRIFRKYGKQYPGPNKIRNVTLWGISNRDSWIGKGGKQFPLLFERENRSYWPNNAFGSVISASK